MMSAISKRLQSIMQPSLSDKATVADKGKYDPTDRSLCTSCRDFLPLDFTRVNPRPTLVDLRRTAGAGCLKCQLLLGGVVKFEHFWQGPSGKRRHHDVLGRWEEDEITVFVNAYQEDCLEVILNRPKRGEKVFESLELEFYSHEGEATPFPEFYHAGDVPKTSESEKSFVAIEGWISECLSNHKLCSLQRNGHPMPTRFLDVVVGEGTQQRLCRRSDLPASAPYAALSHSWGEKEARTKPVPKTQIANIHQRLDGIGWSELTQTFRDAITIARRLNVRYLWIDALCIIQDDSADWAMEASRMASVYENAHFVIAATNSRTGDEGCFSERSCSHKVSVAGIEGGVSSVYVKQKISHRDFAEGPATFETMPLFDRAWVFQERLLATRVIHYTKHEIMWECKESLRCECRGIERGRDFPKGRNTGNFKHRYNEVLRESDNLLRRYQQWTKVLSEYSVRSLHFDGDRLPAFSGIASQLQLPGMGRYLAGIWLNSMPQSLDWKTSVGIVEKRWIKRRPDAYRAPSWSWASVEAECSMWMPDPAEEVEYHSAVQEADCSLVSPDPYGQVSAGHLVLSGPCLWGELRYEKWKDNREEPRYEIFFEHGSVRLDEDVPLNKGPVQVVHGTAVLVIVISSREIPAKYERDKPMWKNHAPERWWSGLALQPSELVDGAFERIGHVSERMGRLAERAEMRIKIV